jgi:hypothetical protein
MISEFEVRMGTESGMAANKVDCLRLDQN